VRKVRSHRGEKNSCSLASISGGERRKRRYTWGTVLERSPSRLAREVFFPVRDRTREGEKSPEAADFLRDCLGKGRRKRTPAP